MPITTLVLNSSVLIVFKMRIKSLVKWKTGKVDFLFEKKSFGFSEIWGLKILEM